MESGACSKQCTCTVPLASFRKVIPSGAELNRHFAASQTSRFEKNTNVLDCRRLPLFEPWHRCLRAFLGTGRQVRFTFVYCRIFPWTWEVATKNLGMFLQMKPLFQISTIFCSFTSVPQGLWEWIGFPIHFPLKVFPQIRQPVGHCLCDHVAVTWQTPYLAEKETGLLFASSLWNLVDNLVMLLQRQPKLWIVGMQIGA